MGAHVHTARRQTDRLQDTVRSLTTEGNTKKTAQDPAAGPEAVCRLVAHAADHLPHTPNLGEGAVHLGRRGEEVKRQSVVEHHIFVVLLFCVALLQG